MIQRDQVDAAKLDPNSRRALEAMRLLAAPEPEISVPVDQVVDQVEPGVERSTLDAELAIIASQLDPASRGAAREHEVSPHAGRLRSI